MNKHSRNPLHSESLEKAALGTLLLRGHNPAVIDGFFALAAPTDFFALHHQAIAVAIKAVRAESGGADFILTWEKMKAQGTAATLKALDDSAYLVGLFNADSHPENLLPGYAAEIAKLARRREGRQSAEAIALSLVDDELPELEKHVEALGKAAEQLKPRRRGRTLEQIGADEVVKPSMPVPTPFAGLNKALAGGLPGGMWTALYAPMKRGKSGLCATMAAFWAEHGYYVLLVCTEATESEVLCRLLAQSSGVAWTKLMRMSKSARDAAAPQPAWHKRISVVVHEPGDSVSSIVDAHIAETGSHPIVVVDHLHDVAARMEERDERRALDKTSDDVKRCAAKHAITILTIGIQSMQTIAGEASRSGARSSENIGKGSSKLGYDSACQLALTSEPFEPGKETSDAEITVAFCRTAPTVDGNSIPLSFHGATGKFTERTAIEQRGPKLTPMDREIIRVIRQREADLNVGAAVTREAIRATLGKARESVNDAIDRLVSLRILAEKPGRAVALVAEVK